MLVSQQEPAYGTIHIDPIFTQTLIRIDLLTVAFSKNNNSLSNKADLSHAPSYKRSLPPR